MTYTRIVCVLVEGQTEEVIVRDVIQPEIGGGIWLQPVILKTSRPAGKVPGRGGVSLWKKIENDLKLLLRNPAFDLVTTLIDYYALPGDTPGMATRPSGSPYDRVRHVEAAIHEAMGRNPRLLPHLALHETEAWVLAAAERLATLTDVPELAKELAAVVAAAGGPELVNDGISTAPSKRIIKLYPAYRKTVDGPLAIADHGLSAIRQVCPHMDKWLTRILEVG
ncbi:DUF4276 family protein [Acrocarpospora catenulata]|uniref:DUF4276 family protein n=1 Tax=Acrocarpospora catenulata TaxID=2836182 RepID=UPI001BDA9606|nr:DUF4276 family protein [Acrocarpospora catenulata]